MKSFVLLHTIANLLNHD